MQKIIKKAMIKFADGHEEILRIGEEKFFIETNLEDNEFCVLVGERIDDDGRFPKMGRRIALVRYDELANELRFEGQYGDEGTPLIFAPVNYHFVGSEVIQ